MYCRAGALHALVYFAWVQHHLKANKLDCFREMLSNSFISIMKNLLNPLCNKVMLVYYLTHSLQYYALQTRVECNGSFRYATFVSDTAGDSDT